MKIVFMGTGEIALPSFEWLLTESGYDVAGLYTQPDKPIGRKQVLTPPEIKVRAQANGVPVFQPTSFKREPEFIESLKSLDCDIAVVMAYGQILPKTVINTPKIACINLHASLLPRHRGASPIQAAIREGDSQSGITLMHIAPKLDAGDMILKSILDISHNETGGALHDKLAELGPELMARGLPLLHQGEAAREPQDESLVTYSGKLAREDGIIDWSQKALVIERLIRAYDPWPGTTTILPGAKKARKIKLYPGATMIAGNDKEPGTIISIENGLSIQCGDNTGLQLTGNLQLEGKKQMPIKDFLKGSNLEPGIKLG